MLGGIRGPKRRGERRRLVTRLEIVVRDLRGDDRVSALGVEAQLERRGEAAVQLGALAGKQVVGDDLAEQRVAKAVLSAAVGDDDVSLRRLAQRRPQHRRRGVGRFGERVVPQRAADGQHAQDVLGRRLEPLHADHQRVAQTRGQRAMAIEPGGQQLFGEKRVSLAAHIQAVDEVVLRCRSQNVLQQPAEFVAGQRDELDTAGLRRTLELGKERPKRMAPMHLVRAIGRDDEDPLAPQVASQEREECARRAVGPMDVLEPQEQRLVASQPVDEPDQRLEHA